jgi:hypothetical protein
MLTLAANTTWPIWHYPMPIAFYSPHDPPSVAFCAVLSIIPSQSRQTTVSVDGKTEIGFAALTIRRRPDRWGATCALVFGGP